MFPALNFLTFFSSCSIESKNDRVALWEVVHYEAYLHRYVFLLTVFRAKEFIRGKLL